MKSKLLFSIFLFITTALFTQTLSFSGEITVASGTTYGNVRPRIAITANAIPIVMWGGGTGTQPLYVARWNGSSFGIPVQITPTGYDPFIDTWAGADMAANGDTVFVVFKRQPAMANNIYCVKSIDGGITWSLPIQADSGTGPYDDFPSVSITPAGNPVIMYMTLDSSFVNAGYAVSNSLDGGATFLPPVNINNLGLSEACDCCPGYMAIDGNTQVACWRRNNNNIRDMWAGISIDGGFNFNTGIDLDNTNWMLSSCPSSGPYPYLINDSLITVFMSGANGANRIMLNTSNIITQQQGLTSEVNGNVVSNAIQNYPFTAGANDTIVLVYQQAISGNTDVLYSYSTTGAIGLLDTSILFNNITTGNQRNPHVAYSTNLFHFVFVDYSTGNVTYKYGSTLPIGISENNISQLPIYPNPSQDNITIDLSMFNSESVNITVYDHTGRLVDSHISVGEKNIVIEKQNAGFYFVSAQNANGQSAVSKIIFY